MLRVVFFFSCFPFSSAEFLAAATNLSSSTTTDPDKVVYPMLKRLPRSGTNFFLHFQLFLMFTFHSFQLADILDYSHPITWESLSTFLFLSGLSLSLLAYHSCLTSSFYVVYSSFWNLTPFFHPAKPASALDGLPSMNFCFFLSPFRMGLTNPGLDLA